MDLVVSPPAEGQPSYQLWHQEVTSTLHSLARSAKLSALVPGGHQHPTQPSQVSRAISSGTRRSPAPYKPSQVPPAISSGTRRSPAP